MCELNQLFNLLDPSPFTERDLDDDAEANIVGWVREVDTGATFPIVVHLPDEELAKARQRGLESAVGNYFAYRAGMLERDLRDQMWIGRRSLVIGIAVLAIATGLGHALRAAFPDSALAPRHRRGHHDLRLGGKLAAGGNLPLRDLGYAPSRWSLSAAGGHQDRAEGILIRNSGPYD